MPSSSFARSIGVKPRRTSPGSGAGDRRGSARPFVISCRSQAVRSSLSSPMSFRSSAFNVVTFTSSRVRQAISTIALLRPLCWNTPMMTSAL